jgi:Ca2+-binding RTX toxin-like protein
MSMSLTANSESGSAANFDPRSAMDMAVSGCGCALCSGGSAIAINAPSPQIDATTPLGLGSLPYYVSALLPTGTPRWNAAAGVGAPANVTFSFMTALPSYADPEHGNEFSPMSSTQKAAVRAALATWADVANITFTEVSDAGAGGSIRLGTNYQSGTIGYARYPSDYSTGGDIYMSRYSSSNTNPTAGDYGFLALIHEIGHAIGLKHPGSYNAGGGTTEGPYLPYAEDNYRYSVMSYYKQSKYDYDVYASAPALFDVAAIQYLYGANTSVRSGNDIYYLSNTTSPFTKVIWDGGGVDTINASAQSKAVEIDLAAGAFSSIGVSDDYYYSASATNNVSIAYGVDIENATGGSGADTINGNKLANTLIGGYGGDTIKGNDGGDTIFGNAGYNTLYGGSGNDTIYGGDDSDYIYGDEGNDVIYSGNGYGYCYGGLGNDHLNGGQDWSTLYGGEGDDLMMLGSGGGNLHGDSGNDVLLGGAYLSSLYGSDGDDTIYAGTYGDFLYGGNGRDSLIGGAKSDYIYGEEGDDTLDGGAGGDTLSGGGGSDTATWHLPSASYKTISFSSTSYSYVYDGKDYDFVFDSSVEYYKFTDGTYAVSNAGTAAQIYRLYGAALGRVPETGGLTNWTAALDAGALTLKQAVTGFTSSAEFLARYGSPDDKTFVTLLYKNVLGRTPDAGGLTNWTNALAAGMSRSDVVLGFSESAEDIAKTKSTVEQGLWLRDDQASQVARLYHATLNRLPDAGGLENWTAAAKAGMTLNQMSDGFTGSVEFQQKYGSLDNSKFVTLLYNNVLGRSPDSGGLTNWINALNAGSTRASVVVGFSESTEHVNARASYIDNGIQLYGSSAAAALPEADDVNVGSTAFVDQVIQSHMLELTAFSASSLTGEPLLSQPERFGMLAAAA